MSISSLLKPTYPIASLRMLMGIIFILHAAVRIYNNTLPAFGEFLGSKGFPFGYYVAWAVTAFELVGGVLMFFRYLVKVFCVGEIFILATGIALVHWKNGWFAADLALGGAEYSVVLITILVAIYIAERKASRNISPLL